MIPVFGEWPPFGQYVIRCYKVCFNQLNLLVITIGLFQAMILFRLHYGIPLSPETRRVSGRRYLQNRPKFYIFLRSRLSKSRTFITRTSLTQMSPYYVLERFFWFCLSITLTITDYPWRSSYGDSTELQASYFRLVSYPSKHC